jgi:hypothetical protein
MRRTWWRFSSCEMGVIGRRLVHTQRLDSVTVSWCEPQVRRQGVVIVTWQMSFGFSVAQVPFQIHLLPCYCVPEMFAVKNTQLSTVKLG